MWVPGGPISLSMTKIDVHQEQFSVRIAVAMSVIGDRNWAFDVSLRLRGPKGGVIRGCIYR